MTSVPPCLNSSLIDRRDVLRVGALAVGGVALPGLSLPAMLAAEPRRIAPRADACIVIFLNGGPSHLDMWDMKPRAPDAIRGEFKPIDTSAPGIQVCEHLPRVARQMHHAALVRSMHHSVNNAHALAVYTALTGHDRGDANRVVGQSGDDHPSPGSMLTLLRPPDRPVVPYVALPYKTQEGAGGPPQPGFFGGLAGRAYDPLWMLSDPNSPTFDVPELSLRAGVSAHRLVARGDLLARLNDGAAQRELSADPMSQFRDRAVELLTSDSTRRALNISAEPDSVREAYGRNIYGQSVLLARRLIEAGTRMVTISWAPDANATWDTHGGNFKKLKTTLLPQFDAAASQLIADLAERGMLERTLVVVTGDFGRSPKINHNDGGRDHWNYCYTVMLAGGGVRGGFVLGSSDKTGAFPASRPVSPGDLMATIYALLGIDPGHELHDALGRPHRVVPKGDIVHELIA